MEDKKPLRSYHTRLIERRTIANQTLALILERPAGFNFRAGQYTVMSVPHEHEAGEEEREFSLASSPYEDTLMVAMRLRDTKFKCACSTLSLGETIELREPAGNLGLSDGSDPEVWLAGGIGVTPLRSIIREACNNGQPINVTMFYSGRSVDTIPFLDELRHCAQTSAGFTLYSTLTGENTAGWDGLKGRINQSMINQHVSSVKTCNYTIVGTRPFVADMRLMLENLGVQSEQVSSERFCGYRRPAALVQ